MYKWNTIPWRKLEKNVFKIQKRIYRASSCDDVRLVRKLQKLLINSWSAKAIAVRRVTQDNQGRKTAGVDGVKSLSPEARLRLIDKLKLGTKVKPTRRVWIPKPGSDEERPLGIPTMYDRALQALAKLALEPEWEAKFEENSYGFRPGRSCHDAIQAIYLCIHTKSKYVLDADIAKCFDCINHGKLLEKLNTFPTLRRQIRAWLKAGVMDGKKLFPTTEGTPQGGVLSPLLANIALHGMENMIKNLAESFNIKRKGSNYQLPKRDKRKSVSLIRYADDFVIIHESEEAIYQCQEAIKLWLNELGLELKPSKTKIAHTLKPHKKEKPGFEFLGFYIHQFKAGKCASAKGTNGIILGFKTQISPSKKSQKKHYKKIAEVIDKYKGVSQIALIKRLNPIIRGWCNYFNPYQCKKVFTKLYSLIHWKLWKWGRKRHRNKGNTWLRHKYWHIIGKDRWVFSTREQSNPLQLIKHSSIPTNIGYVKVKGNASPYNGDLIYWSKRMGTHPQMPKRTASLLKKQKGKCPYCGLTFRENDVIETDHIIPTAAGGKDEYKNLQLLHRHCHDEKSKTDLKVIQKHLGKKRMKETYKWFNRLDWIWVDDIPLLV
ncbi:MAG: group II intron reverse transcriptase/maturase [Xenococcaceae cyanobacterium MO_167.B27]|nr:group II intron reverse transcriptase/maturase [Xenococcaceae cyanobacterium MO_167.B27]